MTRIKSIALILGVLIMSLTIGYLVFAWTEPTSSPPGGNVPAPLNTGPNDQTKPAKLYFSAFYDSNNIFYFVDPSASFSAFFAGSVGIGTVAPGNIITIRVKDLINFGNYNYSTFLGYQAGNNNQTDYNVAIGNNALYSNQSSFYNTAIGTFALKNFASSVQGNNTAVGHSALAGQSGSNFSKNTAVGAFSLTPVTTGTENTAIGNSSGFSLTTGSYNIFLGASAGINSPTTGNNNILIGYKIDTPASNTSNFLSIGNLIFASGGFGQGTSVGTGNVGIGTPNPTSRLTVISPTTKGAIGIGDGITSPDIVFTRTGAGALRLDVRDFYLGEQGYDYGIRFDTRATSVPGIELLAPPATSSSTYKPSPSIDFFGQYWNSSLGQSVSGSGARIFQTFTPREGLVFNLPINTPVLFIDTQGRVIIDNPSYDTSGFQADLIVNGPIEVNTDWGSDNGGPAYYLRNRNNTFGWQIEHLSPANNGELSFRVLEGGFSNRKLNITKTGNIWSNDLKTKANGLTKAVCVKADGYLGVCGSSVDASGNCTCL